MPIGTTLAILASVAALAGSGITIGETLSNLPGGAPTIPTPTTTPAATAAQQQQQNALTRSIAAQNDPNALAGNPFLNQMGLANWSATNIGAPNTAGAQNAVLQAALQSLPSGGLNLNPAVANAFNATAPQSAVSGINPTTQFTPAGLGTASQAPQAALSNMLNQFFVQPGS
jgi:hypothetical protein